MATRRARRVGLAALALAAVVLTGCVGATDRSDFETEIQRRGGGVTSELAAEPLDRLRAELGVDDPELLSLSITPLSRTVVLQVRDPVQRRNVDRYIARGGDLGDPEPVQVSANDDLDARTFRPSELPALGELEGLVDDAFAALGFDDAYVESINVGLRDSTPVLALQVSSPRAVGTAVFDGAGTLLGAEQQ